MQRIAFITTLLISMSLGVGATALGATSAVCRVAIVSSLNEDPVLGMIEQVEVKLSANSQVEVLDRAHTDLLAEEAQLKLGGGLRMEDCSQIGKILNAQLLVVVDRRKDYLSWRILDLKTARVLKLHIMAWPVQSYEHELSSAVMAISNCTTTGQPDGGEISRVAISRFRSEDVSRTHDYLQGVLPELVCAQLAGTTRLMVLERQHLTSLGDERIATGEEAGLSKGTVQIEGAFRLEREQGKQLLVITVAAITPQAGGTREFTVKTPVSELRDAVDQIAKTITRYLQMEPVAGPVLEDEAQRLHLKGRYFFDQEDWLSATELFEAAALLSPEEEKYAFSAYEARNYLLAHSKTQPFGDRIGAYMRHASETERWLRNGAAPMEKGGHGSLAFSPSCVFRRPEARSKSYQADLRQVQIQYRHVFLARMDWFRRNKSDFTKNKRERSWQIFAKAAIDRHRVADLGPERFDGLEALYAHVCELLELSRELGLGLESFDHIIETLAMGRKAALYRSMNEDVLSRLLLHEDPSIRLRATAALATYYTRVLNKPAEGRSMGVNILDEMAQTGRNCPLELLLVSLGGYGSRDLSPVISALSQTLIEHPDGYSAALDSIAEYVLDQRFITSARKPKLWKWKGVLVQHLRYSCERNKLAYVEKAAKALILEVKTAPESERATADVVEQSVRELLATHNITLPEDKPRPPSQLYKSESLTTDREQCSNFTVHDQTCYAVLENRSNSARGPALVQFKLSEGNMMRIKKTPGRSFLHQAPVNQGAFLITDRSVWTVLGGVLHEFRDDGSTVVHKGKESGLPSEPLTCVEACGDRLLLGFRGGVGEWDQKTKGFEILCSSRRSGVDSPLDGVPIYTALDLCYQPQSDSVVAAIPDGDKPGIWSYSFPSKVWSRLAHLPRWDGSRYDSRIKDGLVYVTAHARYLAVYNLAYPAESVLLTPFSREIKETEWPGSAVTPPTCKSFVLWKPALYKEGRFYFSKGSHGGLYTWDRGLSAPQSLVGPAQRVYRVDDIFACGRGLIYTNNGQLWFLKNVLVQQE